MADIHPGTLAHVTSKSLLPALRSHPDAILSMSQDLPDLFPFLILHSLEESCRVLPDAGSWKKGHTVIYDCLL